MKKGTPTGLEKNKSEKTLDKLENSRGTQPQKENDEVRFPQIRLEIPGELALNSFFVKKCDDRQILMSSTPLQNEKTGQDESGRKSSLHRSNKRCQKKVSDHGGRSWWEKQWGNCIYLERKNAETGETKKSTLCSGEKSTNCELRGGLA